MEAYGFDSRATTLSGGTTANLSSTQSGGTTDTSNLLSQLLELNLSIAAKEERKEKVQSPGWPEGIKGKEKFVTDDCVRFEG